MKNKIVEVIICMLLIAIMAIPISALTNVDQTKTFNIENVKKTQAIDADVPTWEVGDSWTYEMYFFENGDENESYSYEVICDITYEVIDDTGDTYTLEGTSDNLDFKLNIGSIILKPTRFLKLGTEIEVQKSDLALVQWYQYAKGVFLPRLGPIPIPLPIQVDAALTTTFDPYWCIMPFPLYDGKNGTLASVNLTDAGKTKLYWGLITIYEGENTWGIHGLNYTCNEEQVTVPAGTYTTYNVSAEYPDYDWFRSYYAEEIGNSVKQFIHISFGNHVTYYHMELDLKSTTYTP